MARRPMIVELVGERSAFDKRKVRIIFHVLGSLLIAVGVVMCYFGFYATRSHRSLEVADEDSQEETDVSRNKESPQRTFSRSNDPSSGLSFADSSSLALRKAYNNSSSNWTSNILQLPSSLLKISREVEDSGESSDEKWKMPINYGLYSLQFLGPSLAAIGAFMIMISLVGHFVHREEKFERMRKLANERLCWR